MSELELHLTALGNELEFPATPAIAGRVREQIERGAERRVWWPRRRALVLVLAVLAVALTAAFAVPQARTAILRIFGIGGVTIERVETLPPARERPLTAGLGLPLDRAAAERRAGFPILLPPLEQGSEPRFYAPGPGFAAVALEHDGTPLLLVELGGSQFDFGKKFASQATRDEEVRVDGAFGLWLEGAPHVVMWRRPDGTIGQHTLRIAGNVLLWERNGRTFRLEGELSRDEAIELAEQVR
jgi:hypothetical protein